MRKNLVICFFLMAAMILIPLTKLDRKAQKPVSVAVTEKDDGIISVMLSENGKVENLDEREYTIGALAAEMDISSHEEALKAQAVACYTYGLYIKDKKLSDELNGADITDNSNVHQGYLNEKQRKEKWGDKFAQNEKKAESIVDAVLGKKIVYNGEPIMAAFHNISSGKTESAKTVWGKDVAYLQSVISTGDKLSPQYSTTVALSVDEFKAYAKKIEGLNLDDNAEKWIGKCEKNDNGLVESIEICSTKIKGSDFRTAFSLKSSNFTASYSSDKFTIKTIGNGHMVGMSQYGADYMARQGADYIEILKHYYTGIDII